MKSRAPKHVGAAALIECTGASVADVLTASERAVYRECPRAQSVRASRTSGVVAKVEIRPRINIVRTAALVEDAGADIADVFVGFDHQRAGPAEIVGACGTGVSADFQVPGGRGDGVRAG